MQTVLRMVLLGFLAGIGAAGLIGLGDALVPGAHAFGYRTGMVGVATGALLQLSALGMAFVAYWLSSRNRMVASRRRLLVLAVWTGSAGFACGFGALGIWWLVK